MSNPAPAFKGVPLNEGKVPTIGSAIQFSLLYLVNLTVEYFGIPYSTLYELLVYDDIPPLTLDAVQIITGWAWA